MKTEKTTTEKNKVGPRIDPWGTPDLIYTGYWSGDSLAAVYNLLATL